MLKRLVETSGSTKKRISPGQIQLSFAFDLRLNQIPDDWRQVSVRYKQVNTVMAIGSEAFGSCVGKINVSVEIENRGAWHCCGWKYMRIIWGRQSGSSLAAEVGDGARYWMAFWELLASLKN